MLIWGFATEVHRNRTAESWYCNIQLSAYLGKLVFEDLGFEVFKSGCCCGF